MITNRDNSGRVFILGAGFSKYLSGGKFPLVAELGSDIQKALPWAYEYAADRNHFDIERALTSLDLDLISEKNGDNRSKLELRRQEIISFLQHRLRIDDIEMDQITDRAEQCLKLLQPGDYILTFNWDCLLEKILMHYKVWKPYDGYGLSLSITQDGEGGRGFNPFFITLLKLHGSLNFLPSSYGGRHIEVASLEGPESVDDAGDKPERKTAPILTLPTYVKDFGDEYDLIEIWREAVEVVANASVLIVIGYSLPRADAMARLLFSFTGQQSRIGHIGIVNWSQADCEHIQGELSKLAELPREMSSYKDVVNWQLLPAETGTAYEQLQEVLARWPARKIVENIARRSAFPDYLELLNKLNKRER